LLFFWHIFFILGRGPLGKVVVVFFVLIRLQYVGGKVSAYGWKILGKVSSLLVFVLVLDCLLNLHWGLLVWPVKIGWALRGAEVLGVLQRRILTPHVSALPVVPPMRETC
jgi:hypothetical protein